MLASHAPRTTLDLVADSLLPLASLHAAAVIGCAKHPPAERGQLESGDASSKPTQAAKWSAPQLSQLVNRLDTQNLILSFPGRRAGTCAQCSSKTAEQARDEEHGTARTSGQ